MMTLSGTFAQFLQLPWLLFKPLQGPEGSEAAEKMVHQLLHRNQVPPIFREPYIIEGYRKPDTTFMYACKSAFRWSNDVGNFWTHFIPLCIFILWFVLEWKWRIDFTDPYFYPLACLWVGSFCCTLFSSIAHLLGCMSYKINSICFFLDYVGISALVLGGGIAAYFYCLPLGSTLLVYKYPLLTSNLLLVFGATLLTGLSRFYWYHYRFAIRIATFLFPYLTTSYPSFIHMLTTCLPTSKDCTVDNAFHYILKETIIFVAIFFYITKIPERYAPGKFDYVLHSHQFFHIMSALQMCFLLYSVPIDAISRRKALSQFEAITPDFLTTFGVFGIGTIGCLLIVIVLGSLVISGSLKPNIHYLKED